MNITDQFTRQHHEMVSLCQQLLECSIEKYISKNASFVHTIQRSLHEVMSLHIRLEDTAFYPMLHEHENPEVRSISLRLQEEFLPGTKMYWAYHERYPSAHSIEKNSSQYIEDTHAVVNEIRLRINKEERELYSLLR